MNFILLILSLFVPLTAQAQWTPAERNWFVSFSERPARFADAYGSTVWGVLAADGMFRSAAPGNSPFVPTLLENARYRTGWIEGNSSFQSADVDGNKKIRAPLIILLPGIFMDGESAETIALANYFYKRGYHVASLPNPWSPRAIRHKPRRKPGDLTFESRVTLELIRSIVEKIGADKVSTVSLLGESYGAILSTAVFATDQSDLRPIINGKVMGISPPLNLRDGASRLDEGIEKNEGRFGECGSLPVVWTLFRKILGRPNAVQSELGERALNCMEPLVFRVFRDSLADSVAAIKSSLINEAGNSEFLPDPSAEARVAPRKTGLRFGKVFDTIVPENKPLLRSPIGDLSYWANQLSPESRERLRIISASDDLLNVGKTWSTDESPAFSKENLFLLPWGGHLGFMADPDFVKLLDIAY
ncbi:MAG: hypothetical protein H7301_07120 [Cryobacterium sp.]|nr:hypothetical protein [Oligoflexia bacterium]